MDYEEKIRELTERVNKLEKAENKRVLKRKIQIITKVIIYGIVIVFLIIGYIHINNAIIKPYKEKVDYIDDKVDKVEDFIDKKIGGLKKYFK